MEFGVWSSEWEVGKFGVRSGKWESAKFGVRSSEWEEGVGIEELLNAEC